MWASCKIGTGEVRTFLLRGKWNSIYRCTVTPRDITQVGTALGRGVWSVSECVGCCLVSPGLETQRLTGRKFCSSLLILFICGHVKNAEDSAKCTPHSGRIISDCWIGQDVKGRGCIIIRGKLKHFPHENEENYAKRRGRLVLVLILLPGTCWVTKYSQLPV